METPETICIAQRKINETGKQMRPRFTNLVWAICLTTGMLTGQDPSVQNDRAELEKILSELAGYQFDQSRQWLPDLQDCMKKAYADPGLRSATEKMLIDYLASDASLAGKQYVCRELGNIGTDHSVPVLAEALMDRDLTGTVLLALEKIPGDRAGRALMKGLESGDDKIRKAVTSSLAFRGTSGAVPLIAEQLHDKDTALVTASIDALGSVGGEKAADALERFAPEAGIHLKESLHDAQLRCAGSLLESGEVKKAGKICEQVYLSDPSLPLKYNALYGMWMTSGEEPVDFIMDILRTEKEEFHPYALRMLTRMETENLDRIFRELPDLPAASRVRLISLAAVKRDRDCRRWILKGITGEHPDIRLASIRAAGRLGEPEDALVLARLASEKRGSERDAARKSLYTLHGPGVNEVIMNGISRAEAGMKAELITAAGERNITGSVPLLFETATNADMNVRIESVKALGRLAPPDRIVDMIDLLVSFSGRRERQETERAILSLSRKIPPGSDRSKGITGAVSEVEDPEDQASLISILGMISDDKDLDVIRKFLHSDNETLKISAIRALSGWKNAAPMQDLKNMAESADDQRTHTLALKGYVDVVNADPQMDAVEKFKEIRHAYLLAGNQAEQRVVVSGLSRIHSLDALEMAIGLLENPDLKQEAEAAILSIAGGTSWGYPTETKAALDEIKGSLENEHVIREVNRILDRIK